jgi:hypothetical protein
VRIRTRYGQYICRPLPVLWPLCGLDPPSRVNDHYANAPPLIAIGCSLLVASIASAQAPKEILRDPSTFATINDVADRSRALFDEAAKVITSPRCLNCHPANNRPTQGNDLHPHLPFATRGEGGVGVPGNTCRECHTDVNFSLKEAASYRSIPGNPRWGLAPIEMAWQGKTVREICQH